MISVLKETLHGSGRIAVRMSCWSSAGDSACVSESFRIIMWLMQRTQYRYRIMFCSSDGVSVRSDVLKNGMSLDGSVNSSSRSDSDNTIFTMESRNTPNVASSSSGGSIRSTTSNT